MKKEETQKVHFKISGTELNVETGYDLYYLSQSMELFNQLISKTYLTLKDEKQMTKEKREDLKIKVFDIRPGSFEADFVIMVKGITSSLLPMVTPLTAKTIWDLTKGSYEYLKTILKANEKGEKLEMKMENSTNSQIINNHGEIVINCHPDVITAAKETYPVFQKLSNMIDEKNETFKKATFSDDLDSEKPIEIGVEEKMLLQNKNILEEDSIEFKGKIYNADAEKMVGKLTVLESEDITEGEYSFEFIDKKNYMMKDYYDVVCEFNALKLTSFNTNTLERKITKLKLVSVTNT